MKYPVEITETLQRIVEIEAASRAEAEEIAEAEWNKEKYVLDSEDFVGATFHAREQEKDKIKVLLTKPTGCRGRRGDIFSNADAGCRKAQQKQAWKTSRYAGIQYSLSTDKKDSGTKKSYMGIVRKEEIGYSKNSYQI